MTGMDPKYPSAIQNLFTAGQKGRNATELADLPSNRTSGMYSLHFIHSETDTDSDSASPGADSSPFKASETAIFADFFPSFRVLPLSLGLLLPS